MLQQTQVSRVVEQYKAFVKRFPSVRHLAASDEQEVLAMWQGLGYYRRARHLHAAAKMIASKLGGRVPRRTNDLLQLPGVGRYTAAAIASIVYGEHEAVVDGNVLRVLARLEARRGSGRDPSIVEWAWGRAGALVAAAAEPGVLNEALMELGAVVCTPKRPRCDACPVTSWCKAAKRGRQEAIPAPKPAVARKRVHHHAVVIFGAKGRGEKVLLERRSDNGMWSNMWQVPTIEAGRPLGSSELTGALPGRVTGLKKQVTFVHQTTHRHITFHVYTALGHAALSPRHPRNGRWRRADDVDDLPMSNAQRRVLESVSEVK
jgi:A/G-specific adenine glycosylase